MLTEIQMEGFLVRVHGIQFVLDVKSNYYVITVQ